MKDFFQRYVDYLKDNPEGYWFKRKLFGWGWTPVTWQGWVVTLGFIALILGNGIRFEASGATDGDVLLFFGETVILIILLILIAWRTGEAPKWQWGIPKKKEDQDPSA